LILKGVCFFVKRIFVLVLAALMLAALVLASCEKKVEEIGEDIDTKASVQAILENAKAAAGEGAFIPMTLEIELSGDNCKGYTGLSPEEFEKYAMDGFSMVAAINAQAFDLALIKCKDYASAKEVKKLIAAGFNPAERICAVSEVAFVVESGRFVLLGGVSADTAGAFQKAFADQFETAAGEVNTFFERSGDDPAGDGGMGALIPG